MIVEMKFGPNHSIVMCFTVIVGDTQVLFWVETNKRSGRGIDREQMRSAECVLALQAAAQSIGTTVPG